MGETDADRKILQSSKARPAGAVYKMTTQTQYHSHATLTLEQSKCYICGQTASHEIKELKWDFCDRHWRELQNWIIDHAIFEAHSQECYQNYIKQNPALKQNDSHLDNQSNKED